MFLDSKVLTTKTPTSFFATEPRQQCLIPPEQAEPQGHPGELLDATQQPTITGGPDTVITAANLQDPEIKKSFLISLYEVQTPVMAPASNDSHLCLPTVTAGLRRMNQGSLKGSLTSEPVSTHAR